LEQKGYGSPILPCRPVIIPPDERTVEHEQLLRWVLILGFVAVFPIALYHRLKSQAGGEKLKLVIAQPVPVADGSFRNRAGGVVRDRTNVISP